MRHRLTNRLFLLAKMGLLLVVSPVLSLPPPQLLNGSPVPPGAPQLDTYTPVYHNNPTRSINSRVSTMPKAVGGNRIQASPSQQQQQYQAYPYQQYQQQPDPSSTWTNNNNAIMNAASVDNGRYYASGEGNNAAAEPEGYYYDPEQQTNNNGYYYGEGSQVDPNGADANSQNQAFDWQGQAQNQQQFHREARQPRHPRSGGSGRQQPRHHHARPQRHPQQIPPQEAYNYNPQQQQPQYAEGPRSRGPPSYGDYNSPYQNSNEGYHNDQNNEDHSQFGLSMPVMMEPLTKGMRRMYTVYGDGVRGFAKRFRTMVYTPFRVMGR